MSQYCGYSSQWLNEHGALHTAREIHQQPALWRELTTLLSQHAGTLSEFLSPLLANPELRIILTGAGTSAFAGEALAPFLQQQNRHQVQAVATTDIVANPHHFLAKEKPTLVVSFARSGNSPESVAAVNLANQCIDQCWHLFLTCNPEGELYHHAASHDNAMALLMPEKANDQSFAMTSSFSCMLLAAYALLSHQPSDETTAQVSRIAALCEEKLSQWLQPVKALAAKPYQRLVILGSGGLAGLAREAALKSLELSAGQVMTAYDSSLGFRHGPKFTINSSALVIQMIAGDPYTRRYDLDLYRELTGDGQAMDVIALTGQALNGEQVFELGQTGDDDFWLCFPYIVFSQLLAFEKSLQLGLCPDNPCPTGEVNRVVQGVIIHPLQQ